MKALKLWNGRGHGKYAKDHISVAAYSKKQAAEIISIACESYVTVNEITHYYSNCWGNNMNGIKPAQPCVYIDNNLGTPNPIKVYWLPSLAG